jgi:hypothetical protein
MSFGCNIELISKPVIHFLPEIVSVTIAYSKLTDAQLLEIQTNIDNS